MHFVPAGKTVELNISHLAGKADRTEGRQLAGFAHPNGPSRLEAGGPASPV
jgi:hypothetical protein